MRKSNSTVAGRKLALQMIREIQADGMLEKCDFEDEFREKGTPPLDIVAEYLVAAQDMGLLSGFTSMLTYYLTFEHHVGAPNRDWLELVAKHPIERAKEIWAGRQKRGRRGVKRDHIAGLKRRSETGHSTLQS